MNTLAVKFPDLEKEWHPTKNNGLTPYQVTCGSNKIIWWRCEDGHEFEMRVSDRTRGRGCPYKARKKTDISLSLQEKEPDISIEWNVEKNNGLKPESVLPFSHKIVSWRCKEGHEWDARIGDRVKNKTGCPFCSGKKASKENCLKNTHSHLLSSWHPTKNKELTPSNVTYGSRREAWWSCEQGHEYRSPIYRKSRGFLCPHCKKEKRDLKRE